MKFTILVDPSLDIKLNTVPSVCVICAWEKRRIFLIMHFHYITYIATPWHKNLYPRAHEIYNFGRPFLGHHYYKLSLYGPCPGENNKIFKEIHQFCNFYPQITSPWRGEGMKFTISCLFTLKMLYTKFGQDWPSRY